GVSLTEALTALGRPATEAPRHPVIHGAAGTLVSFGLPTESGTTKFLGVWITARDVQFLDPEPKETPAATAHGLAGVSARLFELFLTAARAYLERIEEIDERLADIQQRGRSVPLAGASVGLAECSGRYAERFDGFAGAASTPESELLRVRELAGTVQQGLSDLILLRNAEESNRIAEAANNLSRTSNRIAALANTSNIRMLGLTYIALVLGLVSAAVLIPNTGATILGMPSAGWVPGVWVDVILVVLAIVPIWLIFSRRFVLRILRDISTSESRAQEGLDDLPEISASDAARASTPPRSTAPGKPL
ncbi:MAG: hypothetical protein L3J91_02330, partial [Thermoplasmata archaeon]|nr:hypothetical protein [Thermoplasmata archaeon]